ncbi:MinD/ParA family ATP-binding protein [Rhodococcoides fascians]|uniref:MinD/ParA family ATP-binding protein n=1 Tax=Rhodococcoides fascians TaxID=1828 RepID=UPI00050C7CAF|nr:hypothetical protein [Rhodococcus fascians]
MTQSSTDTGYLAWLTPTAAPGETDENPAPEPAAPTSPRPGTGAADDPVVVVVAGAHGGSGATVATVLLALIAASESTSPVIALDGTPVGGDLATRAPAGQRYPTYWQDWFVGDSSEPAALPETGWCAIARDRTLPEQHSPLADAVAALRAMGRSVIVDAGASVGSPWFEAVADLADHIVVTIDDRAGAANAARPVLSMLRQRLGASQMGHAVQLLVTSQRPGIDHVTGPLADALAGRVAGVHHLPYDPEIAAGIEIDPALLSSSSFDAAHTVHTRTHPKAEQR